MAIANIIGFKWDYKCGSEYVNTLYSLISRHMKSPFRFVCLTDDNSDLVQGIEYFSIPKVNITNGPDPAWNKLSNWSGICCQSFKYNSINKDLAAWFTAPVKPAGTKIVSFHGKPNPPDAILSHSGKRYKKVLPTTWVAEHWK